MADGATLSLAFIDRRPVAAGRALAAMDSADAAAFIASIPTRFAARVLAHLGAWSAAGILGDVSADKSAAVLRELVYTDAAAILRLMTPGARNEALARVPARLRRDFETTLAFPEDTVGAQMTTRIVTQRTYHTVGDAITQFRRADNKVGDLLFVVDDDNRLLGYVTAAQLVRYDQSTVLDEIMETAIETLSARARVESIAHSEGWDRHAFLPVFSRAGHLIGALPRAGVAPWRAGKTPAPNRDVRGIGAAMADALVAVLAGLGSLSGRRDV